jgi:hypothetical protein
MKKYQELRLQAELWEIQVWMMWILALLLWETEHYVLFGLVLLSSLISFVGTIVKVVMAKNEEAQVGGGGTNAK